ncbi:MAG: hypothetical protein MUO52_19400 [Desulfobacterales bacterium]|nr:hypothetical protein [Desulfobacterales bacterium]
MAVAGGLDNLHFAKGAFKRIYAHSRGNPRRINAVCDRALLSAYVKEKHTITKGMVETAIQELQWETKPKAVIFRGWTWKRFASFFTLLLFLVITVAFLNSTYRQEILRNLLDRGEAIVFKVLNPLPSSPKPRVVNPQQNGAFLKQ